MNIGSLWLKETRDGKKYFSGNIQSPFLPGGEISISVWKNNEKKSENSPDYSISWQLKKEDKAQSVGYGNEKKFEDDDIPF